MRVNTESGAWVCMACREKGGDVLAYLMKAHGLGFVQAAGSLGAFVDDGKPYCGSRKPTTLPARDAMEVTARQLLVLLIVISDVRRGLLPSEADWQRFIEGVGRIESLAAEYRT